mmetsp:Transcript_34347/g.42309  ORF Transcript_34347/g.42309 Transcript_34347/m.42309 type:complete len:239 (-) Transcript_34347:88-804(-)
MVAQHGRTPGEEVRAKDVLHEVGEEPKALFFSASSKAQTHGRHHAAALHIGRNWLTGLGNFVAPAVRFAPNRVPHQGRPRGVRRVAGAAPGASDLQQHGQPRRASLGPGPQGVQGPTFKGHEHTSQARFAICTWAIFWPAPTSARSRNGREGSCYIQLNLVNNCSRHTTSFSLLDQRPVVPMPSVLAGDLFPLDDWCNRWMNAWGAFQSKAAAHASFDVSAPSSQPPRSRGAHLAGSS